MSRNYKISGILLDNEPANLEPCWAWALKVQAREGPGQGWSKNLIMLVISLK